MCKHPTRFLLLLCLYLGYAESYILVEGPYGECSKSCGSGHRQGALQCWNSAGLQEELWYCPGQQSSAVTHQECNAQLCPEYRYETSPWSICSATCGGGVTSRSKQCVYSQGIPVDEAHCLEDPNEMVAPFLERKCNSAACVEHSWVTGPWSACPSQSDSVPCSSSGTNTPRRRREVACWHLATGRIIDDEEPCLALSSRPISTAACPPAVECVGESSTPGRCTSDAGCSGAGRCDLEKGACDCDHAYTGIFCDIAATCAGHYANQTDPAECCPDGWGLDVHGACCSSDPRARGRDGVCCPEGQLADPCGVCGGSTKGIDSLGKCCQSGILDAGGMCCESGWVDECGVCDGVDDCPVEVTVSAGAEDIADLDVPSVREAFETAVLARAGQMLVVSTSRLTLHWIHIEPSGAPNVAQPQSVSGRFLHHVDVDFVILPPGTVADDSAQGGGMPTNASVVTGHLTPPHARFDLTTYTIVAALGSEEASRVQDGVSIAKLVRVERVGSANNSVCEVGEADPHSENYCPHDCPLQYRRCLSGRDIGGAVALPEECSAHGHCSPATGSCSCSPGYKGDSCSECSMGFYADAFGTTCLPVPSSVRPFWTATAHMPELSPPLEDDGREPVVENYRTLAIPLIGGATVAAVVAMTLIGLLGGYCVRRLRRGTADPGEREDSPASTVRPRVTSATGLLINVDGESIPLDYRSRKRFLPRAMSSQARFSYGEPKPRARRGEDRDIPVGRAGSVMMTRITTPPDSPGLMRSQSTKLPQEASENGVGVSPPRVSLQRMVSWSHSTAYANVPETSTEDETLQGRPKFGRSVTLGERYEGGAETPSTSYLGFLATGWNPLMRFTSNYTCVGDDSLEAVELQPTTSQSGLLADVDHDDCGQDELEGSSPGERTRLWVTQGAQGSSNAPPTDVFVPQPHSEERYPSGRSTESAPAAAPAKQLASMLAGALKDSVPRFSSGPSTFQHSVPALPQPPSAATDLQHGAGPGAVSRHQSAASSIAMITLDEEDESGTSVSRHHSAASSIGGAVSRNASWTISSLPRTEEDALHSHHVSVAPTSTPAPTPSPTSAPAPAPAPARAPPSLVHRSMATSSMGALFRPSQSLPTTYPSRTHSNPAAPCAKDNTQAEEAHGVARHCSAMPAQTDGRQNPAMPVSTGAGTESPLEPRLSFTNLRQPENKAVAFFLGAHQAMVGGTPPEEHLDETSMEGIEDSSSTTPQQQPHTSELADLRSQRTTTSPKPEPAAKQLAEAWESATGAVSSTQEGMAGVVDDVDSFSGAEEVAVSRNYSAMTMKELMTQMSTEDLQQISEEENINTEFLPVSRSRSTFPRGL